MVVVVREHLVTLLRSAAQALYPAEPMGALLPFPTRQGISTTVLDGTSKPLKVELDPELARKVHQAVEEMEEWLAAEGYPLPQ